MTSKAVRVAALRLVFVAALVFAATGMGIRPPAAEAVTGYKVANTGGLGANIRTGPGTNYSVAYTLNDGAPLNIACQIKAQTITVGGYTSNVWDELGDGNYISDLFTTTPVIGDYSPGIPHCTSSNSYTVNVSWTGGTLANIHSQPSTSSPVVYQLRQGAPITISCQERAQSVTINGVTSAIWDRLNDGNYLSDLLASTPVVGDFSPGIGRCAQASYHIANTGGVGVNVRTGPSTAYPVAYRLNDGNPIGINCQTSGQTVTLGTVTSAVWDRLDDGNYVSDLVTDTPGIGTFSPGLSVCPGSPPLPPPPTRGLWYGQTYGQPGNGHFAKNPTGQRSDPVDSLTGAYWTTATDLQMTGVGVPFQMTRTYTSADSEVGPLGRGWTFSFGAALLFDPTRNAVLRGDDGQQVAFTLQADGSYQGPPGTLSTLAKLPSGDYEVVTHAQTHYRFDSTGRLTSITDRNGQGVTLTYAAGNLQSVTDAAGHTVDFTTDDQGFISSVTLPDGRSVQYAYTNGLLTSVTDARGGITQYAYNSDGLLTQITDANGNTVVQNTYDPTGRVTQQVDGQGNTSSLAWDPTTQTSTLKDANGGAWTDVYNDQNLLAQRTDPLGNTTAYTYDASFNRTAVTDPRGNTTTYTYDDRGNMTSQTAPAPLSYQQTWTYNATNDPLTYTDGRGNTTTYDYDSAGNLIAVHAPGGAATTYTRNAAGLITSKTDPLGNTTRYTYDANGDTTSITTPNALETTITYDQSGRKTSIVDPRGNLAKANPDSYRTAYTYDSSDDLTSITDPLGDKTVYAYDAVGNKTSTTDPLGNQATYTYNADRLIRVDAPEGSTTRYTYDPVGNLLTITDANGRTTTFEYDAADRQTSKTDALGNTWTTTYDRDGNRHPVADPTAVTTTYTYDAVDRPTQISYSDNTPTVTFGYDPNGNRTSMTDGQGTQQRTYNERNQLTGVTRGSTGFTYTYDLDGNITQRTYPDGTVYTYAYNPDNLLLSVTTGGHKTSYTYDAADNPFQIVYPNGAETDEQYDAANRVLSIRNRVGSTIYGDFAYTYDADGNPTQVVTTAGQSQGTETFAYDGLNRLSRDCTAASCSPTTVTTWTYDAVGNRLTQVTHAGTTNYTYNANDELTQVTNPSGTTVHYGYDSDGRETIAGARSFAYNGANELTSTSKSGVTTKYAYDGDGNRVAAGATGLTWDVNGQLPNLALEQTTTGKRIRRYEYGNSIIAMTTPKTTAYYQTDRLGSITTVTAGTGALLWQYTYSPYGTPRIAFTAIRWAPPNPARFQGQYRDATGLYDLRAREYDPASGRFLQQDPVPSDPISPTMTTYGYAGDNPIAEVDPSGASWLDSALSSVGAIGDRILSVSSLFSERAGNVNTSIDLGVATAACLSRSGSCAGLAANLGAGLLLDAYFGTAGALLGTLPVRLLNSVLYGPVGGTTQSSARPQATPVAHLGGYMPPLRSYSPRK
jgi:RHS repeat-associated protein